MSQGQNREMAQWHTPVKNGSYPRIYLFFIKDDYDGQKAGSALAYTRASITGHLSWQGAARKKGIRLIKAERDGVQECSGLGLITQRCYQLHTGHHFPWFRCELCARVQG